MHAPRRYGKTSLLQRTLEVSASNGVAVGYVNLLRCSNRREVAQALVHAVFSGPLAGRTHVKRLAGLAERIRVRPRLDVRPDGSLSVSFEPQMAERDWSGVLLDAGRLASELAGKRSVGIILDEFQQVAEVDRSLPGVFKALLDENPSVSFVLAGSHTHLMEQLTTRPAAPLLGMGEVLRLGPIPVEEMVEFLARRATYAGKAMEPTVAERICSLAGPVPNDIQRLAQHAYDVAAQRVDDEAVEVGMALAVDRQSTTFAERYERLSPVAQRLLGLMALEPITRPYTRENLDRVEVANDNAVRKALAVLEESELAARRDGVWHVADPFMRRWLCADK